MSFGGVHPFMLKKAAAAPSGDDYITAEGGTIYTEDTDYKVHVFIDSSEDFEITDVSGSGRTFDVMMLGGGGGCGETYSSGTYMPGGGGAGGLVRDTGIAASVGSWAVNVGAGGPTQTTDGTAAGTQGTLTSFTGRTSAAGGGLTENGGGGAGADGGCGGGGPGHDEFSGGAGSQGGNGGAGGSFYPASAAGGGGGVGLTGTGANGANGVSGTSGDGGDGYQASSWISADSATSEGVGEVDGDDVYFGGGGDGASAGTGADPGKGSAFYYNTGGGGLPNGGTGPIDGADGIVIVRYKFQN